MNKQALKPAVTWGLISFGTGASINLIFMLLVGEVYTSSIISIVVCAVIGLLCGISIYRIRTR